MACAIAGLLYAWQQNIPLHLALAALPAFLLEATFYSILGVERWRTRLEKRHPAAVAGLLTLAAAVPYAAASLAFGGFRWQALAWVAGLAPGPSLWFALLPPKPPGDPAFR